MPQSTSNEGARPKNEKSMVKIPQKASNEGARPKAKPQQFMNLPLKIKSCVNTVEKIHENTSFLKKMCHQNKEGLSEQDGINENGDCQDSVVEEEALETNGDILETNGDIFGANEGILDTNFQTFVTNQKILEIFEAVESSEQAGTEASEGVVESLVSMTLNSDTADSESESVIAQVGSVAFDIISGMFD